MKARMMFAAGVLSSLVSSSAFAQDADGEAAGATATKMRLGAQIEMLPLGSAEVSAGGVSASSDAAVAYGVSATFDYAVTPWLSIGAAPRLVLNVNQKDAPSGSDAGKEVDVRARLVAHYPVMPRVEVYGALQPGYSFVIPSQGDTQSGFAIGGAIGATYDVSPKLYLSGEIGYQRAFTSIDEMVGASKVSADFNLSYMHIGLGAGTRF